MLSEAKCDSGRWLTTAVIRLRPIAIIDCAGTHADANLVELARFCAEDAFLSLACTPHDAHLRGRSGATYSGNSVLTMIEYDSVHPLRRSPKSVEVPPDLA